MKSLEERVLAALGNDTQKSPWEELISLFQADKEAFYLLACERGAEQTEARVRDLAEFADKVRAAVQESYEIVPANDGANLTAFSGETTFIPANFVEQARQFLREIDGKTTTTIPGKDYEGVDISEAEVRFKLGDRAAWESEQATLEAHRKAKPFVLQLAEDDLTDLTAQPAYVTYELLHCARRMVLAPTAVFRGLKRGEGGPPKVNRGWAFCGKPRQAYDNDGRAFPAHDDMVYVLYADEDGYVFDWDWVKENPNEPGLPLDCDLRFDEPVPNPQEAILDLPKHLVPGKFDATKACYSGRGDCIFCYVADDVSFAERINSDLTTFKKLGSDEITGFKVKNVRRILHEDVSIKLDDAPDLTVSVDAILLATLKLHKEASVHVYQVIIRALYDRTTEPPKVTLPEEDEALARA